VYANRETLDGVTYGGVRVNTNMLFSQLYSLGGSQMLRALFLIGEGGIGQVDPVQYAFGDNLISGYDLNTSGNTAGRVSIYLNKNGGRLQSSDHVAGRAAGSDDGNSQNAGGQDVYSVRYVNNGWTPNFCYVHKPSTQTEFGLYSPIGNDLGYRLNPRVQPAVNAQLKPKGDKGNSEVVCTRDVQAVAGRNKQNTTFSSRSGLIARNGSLTSNNQQINLSRGDRLTYRMLRSSDAKTVFRVKADGPDGKETCTDVAQGVSGRQRGWDDALVIGDQYRVGSAMAVCVQRTPDDAVFISNADNFPVGGGQKMDCILQVTEPGRAQFTSAERLAEDGTANRSHKNGTNTSHVFKVAVATFVIQRPAQVIEIGLRSSVGLRVSGLMNFRDSRSYTETDAKACYDYEGNTIKSGDLLVTQNFASGTYSGPEQRYSFFKLAYRVAGSDSSFTTLPQCFGVRSVTQQPVYNYLRVELPEMQRWEFRLVPVSGWEIRNNIATGSLEVMDPKMKRTRRVTGSGVVVTYTGEAVARNRSTFAIPCTLSDEPLGIPKMDDQSYVDDWGKVAELFPFEELSASTGSPEHEVVYVNKITPNITTPNYDNLATVGVNIRSSTEFNQLSQFSVYVNQGLKSTHLFPEVLLDLMTNTRYGVGEILSSEQIDQASFASAAAWTQQRRYFFDGAISEKINLRSWGAQTADYFLLDLLVKNGKFALQPAAQFDQPEPITGLFTSGNILADSFQLAYLEQQERQPPRVSVKWREEKQSGDAAKRGLFPVLREVTIREAGTPDDAPLEQVDLSDFCTSEVHAVDYGKWLCRVRRLVTHTVSLKTTPDQAALDLGKVFKLGMETVAYEQPNNGIITSDGTVTAMRELSDGSYPVLLWDGTGNEIREVTLNISGGVASDYRSAVFCIRDSVSAVQTYKVQSLAFDEDGNLDVEATHFPTDERGFSLITQGWNVDGNWVIEGAIGNSDNPAPLYPVFEGVTLLGPAAVMVGGQELYTALIEGPDDNYTYQWAATNGAVISSPTASQTAIQFTSAGESLVTVTVAGGGVQKSASKLVTVGAVSVVPIV